jgi:hypothetical protein
MSIQRDPFNWSGALYEKYCSEITTYIQTFVLPSLNEKRQLNSITFLREWPLRFDNHRLVEKGLADMFTYLVCFFSSQEQQLSIFSAILSSVNFISLEID